MKDTLSVLRGGYVKQILISRSFASFIASVLFTQSAFNMMNVVLIFLIFNLTSSSFSVSMLILTYVIPQVVFSFLGGIIADLKSKKNILIIGNVLRAGVVLLLFINPDSQILVYLVALVLSIVTQFYVPAEAPLIPYLVGKKDLLVANSIFGTVLFGSTLVGYVLAGPLIQLFGNGGAFIGIAFLYAVAAVLAAFIPANSQRVEGERYSPKLVRQTVKEEIHGLYQLLRYTKQAGNSFFLLAFSQVVVLILANIVPGYAENVLHVSVENLSLLVFAPAALGLIISALMMASIFKEKDKHKLMNMGVLLSGAVLILFPLIAFLDHVPMITSLFNNIDIIPTILVPLLSFLAGFANALIYVPSQTYIQEIVPESSRSKIFGLLFSLIGAMSLIPIVVSGGLADVFGVETVLISLGCVILLMGYGRIKYKK